MRSDRRTVVRIVDVIFPLILLLLDRLLHGS